MTNDQGRPPLWNPARNDFKGTFLILTLTFVSSYSHTYSHMYTHSHTQLQTATGPVDYFTILWAIWSKRRQHSPPLMQGLICEENVCLCKASKKIIVTAYVTGVD